MSMRDYLRRRATAAGELGLLARQGGRGLVGVTLVLHAVIGLMPIVFIVCVSRALEAIVSRAGADGGQWGNSPAWLAVALGALFLQQLLVPFQAVASQAVSRRVDGYCVSRLMKSSTAAASLRELESPDVAQRLGDVHIAFDTMAQTPGAAVEGGLALVARYTQLLGAVVVVGYAFTWWAALCVGLVALVIRHGQTAAYVSFGALWRGLRADRRKQNYVRELAMTTTVVKEIRTLRLADWLDERYRRASDAYLTPLWQGRRAIYGPPFLRYTAIGLISGTGVLVWLALGAGHGSPGDLVRLTVTFQALLICLRFGVYFPESDPKLQYGRAAFESLLEFEGRVAELTDQARELPGPRPGAPADRTAAGPTKPAELRLEAVGFRYGEESEPVLSCVDLTMPAGTSTAVVGLNGAGKTTLAKIVAGLYEPTSGRVVRGGAELTAGSRHEWQRRLAVTFQDFIRYELSVRENVAMGAVQHLGDEEGVRAVLDRVGLLDLVDDLPDGLDTPLSRHRVGGRELSGGEWQRLALARSLFAVRHGASVLILDEPTAQLDARGEAEFFRMFLDVTEGVTSLIISHRFSTVRRADQIVVLEAGVITERGTHEELVARDGTYAGMFAVQARRFARTAAEQ